MSNKIKISILIAFVALVLCGCSGTVATIDTMFGGSITDAINTDTAGLMGLANVAKFDNGIHEDFQIMANRNASFRDQLLQTKIESGELILKVSKDSSGSGLIDINLKDSVAIDYASMSAGITVNLLSKMCDDIEGQYNSIEWLYGLIGSNEDVSEIRYDTRYSSFTGSWAIYIDDVKQIKQNITPFTVNFLNVFCDQQNLDSDSYCVNSEGTFILGQREWMHEMFGIKINDGEHTVENSYESGKSFCMFSNMRNEVGSLQRFLDSISTDWASAEIKSDNTVSRQDNNYRMTVKLNSKNRNKRDTVEVTVTRLGSSNNKDVFKCSFNYGELQNIFKYIVNDGGNPKKISTFTDAELGHIKDDIRAMAQGEIYVLKADTTAAQIENFRTLYNLGNSNAFDNIFTSAQCEKKLSIEKSSRDIINTQGVLKDIDIPLKLTSGIEIGTMKKTSICSDYVMGITGCDSDDITPTYAFKTDGNGKSRLYLLKYPVARITKIKKNGDRYKLYVEDSGMWTNICIKGTLYNKFNTKDTYSYRTNTVYLYDDKSVEWLTSYKVKYNPLADLKVSSSQFSIAPKPLSNGITPSGVDDKTSSGVDDKTSRFVLMSYLEGIYLPGKYPEGTLTTSTDVENVLALGRRIQLDKNAIDDANGLQYSAKIGDIYSALNNREFGWKHEVRVSNLISAAQGGFMQTKITGGDGVLQEVRAEVKFKNVTSAKTAVLKANQSSSTKLFVKSGKSYKDIGYYIKSDKDSAGKYYTLPIKYEIGTNGDIVLYIGWCGGNTNNLYKDNKGTTIEKECSLIRMMPSDIKAEITSGISGYSKDAKTDTWNNMVRITVAKTGTVTNGDLCIKITPSHGNSDIKYVSVTFPFNGSTAVTSNCGGGIIRLASSSKLAGAETRTTIDGQEYVGMYVNTIKISQLMHPEDTSKSGLLAHIEHPSYSIKLPKLYVMGVDFSVHDNDFDKWINEEQDPDGDGNLRTWIGVLQGWGYKTYPMSDVDGIEAIVDDIKNALKNTYNFGDAEDVDSSIILDTAVIKKVQDEIDANSITNEAKIIRAVAKILGVLLSFLGFLWLVAWLVDAGTTGDGNGALYFVTFKHMRTGAGMSRKEALEMSTEGYKYVTASGIAKRVFILMAIGVTLIIVDPIQLVSVVISWVDGAYRLIRENIFNVKDGIN